MELLRPNLTVAKERKCTSPVVIETDTSWVAFPVQVVFSADTGHSRNECIWQFGAGRSSANCEDNV